MPAALAAPHREGTAQGAGNVPTAPRGESACTPQQGNLQRMRVHGSEGVGVGGVWGREWGEYSEHKLQASSPVRVPMRQCAFLCVTRVVSLRHAR